MVYTVSEKETLAGRINRKRNALRDVLRYVTSHTHHNNPHDPGTAFPNISSNTTNSTS